MKNYIVIIAAGFLLVGCSAGKAKTAEAVDAPPADEITFTEAQMQNAGIGPGSAAYRTVTPVLRVNGNIEVPPQNMVSVSFPMGGYLRSTQLLPGMRVRKGQVIAVMEDQGLVQLQQDYLMALARFRYLKQEYERQKTLHENMVNAGKVFEQVQADYESQQVLVKGLSEKLRLIDIDPDGLTSEHISRSIPLYSPIDGYVSKVKMNIGRYVNPSDVLFELINPDDLHAALTVFEKDLAKVKTGQRVKVSFVDDPSKQYDCEVILVTRNVDEDRSGAVHCHFETKPANLLPGMFLNASIRLSSARALTVPEEAIVRYGNKQYVFEVVAKNRFRMQEVQTGISEDGYVTLADTAAEWVGRPIVVKNAYAVLSKMKNTAEEE